MSTTLLNVAIVLGLILAAMGLPLYAFMRWRRAVVAAAAR